MGGGLFGGLGRWFGARGRRRRETDTPTDALMVCGVGEGGGCLVVWEEEEVVWERWRINRL